jgi:hypothetical protein
MSDVVHNFPSGKYLSYKGLKTSLVLFKVPEILWSVNHRQEDTVSRVFSLYFYNSIKSRWGKEIIRTQSYDCQIKYTTYSYILIPDK